MNVSSLDKSTLFQRYESIKENSLLAYNDLRYNSVAHITENDGLKVFEGCGVCHLWYKCDKGAFPTLWEGFAMTVFFPTCMASIPTVSQHAL